MTQKILVASIAVMVRRDAMTNIPVQVPAHELAALKTLHGREQVVVDDTAKADPVELEVAAEADRLVAKYGPEVVEKAYGADFESAVPEALAKHAVKVDEGGDGQDDTGDELADLTKDELLAMAADRGVKADASMKKAAIAAAIRAAG